MPAPPPPHRTPGGVLAESRSLPPMCSAVRDSVTSQTVPTRLPRSSPALDSPGKNTGAAALPSPTASALAAGFSTTGAPWEALWSFPQTASRFSSASSSHMNGSRGHHTSGKGSKAKDRGRSTQRTGGKRPSHRGQKQCLGKTRKPKQILLRMTEKGTALVTQRECY